MLKYIGVGRNHLGVSKEKQLQEFQVKCQLELLALPLLSRPGVENHPGQLLVSRAVVLFQAPFDPFLHGRGSGFEGRRLLLPSTTPGGS